MRDGPLVSIIISNYNYSRFLRSAIDSALAQTYSPVEVIVVDDGSEDNSREVIESYADRVKMRFQANGGQASAFNAGFAISKGQIVNFLDADDALLPDAIATEVSAWQPGVAKLQFGLECMDAMGRRLDVCWPTVRMSASEASARLRKGWVLSSPPTSGNAFSRRTLTHILPMPEREWRIAADTYLLALSPFLGEIITLDTTLGLYRLHDLNNFLSSESDLSKVRRMLALDLATYDALRRSRTGERFPSANDWLMESPGHISSRLQSLRLDPKRHPFQEDRRGVLLMRGIAACMKSPLYTRKARAIRTGWLSLLALAPSKIVRVALRQRSKVSRASRLGMLAPKRARLARNFG